MNQDAEQQPASASPVAVRNLRIEVRSGAPIVEGVDLSLEPGEILGLVGESGSGKTTTGLAMLGYTTPGAVIVDGTLNIRGLCLRLDESMAAFRGRVIAYVPQNPGRSLNPSMRIADYICDLLDAHRIEGDRKALVGEALAGVGLPTDADFAHRYPHQLSGGQQQRVCIAAALACDPALLILDEPTTGLDVVSQAKVLEQLAALRGRRTTSMVYVTHDLAVVAQLADRVAVMYAGQIVEQGPTARVLKRPAHPYTRGLIASIPDHIAPAALEAMPGVAVGVGERLSGCSFTPRCPQAQPKCGVERPQSLETGSGHFVSCWRWKETEALTSVREIVRRREVSAQDAPVLSVSGLAAHHGSGGRTVVAATDVSFAVHRGQCVALVGESGSGKTTIARAVAGLHPAASGTVALDGEVVDNAVRRRSVEQRRKLQMIFQNPSDALNPRRTVFEAIARPARTLRGLRRDELASEVAALLDHVRLPARIQHRYPAQLSGGERQRVAIARALAAGPDIILCDEITSALDVSVQAAVLDVLDELRRETGLALLFITHDLGVVAAAADEVLVLEGGVVSERGAALDVLHRPQGAYTRRLVEAAPSLSKEGMGATA